MSSVVLKGVVRYRSQQLQHGLGQAGLGLMHRDSACKPLVNFTMIRPYLSIVRFRVQQDRYHMLGEADNS